MPRAKKTGTPYIPRYTQTSSRPLVLTLITIISVLVIVTIAFISVTFYITEATQPSPKVSCLNFCEDSCFYHNNIDKCAYSDGWCNAYCNDNHKNSAFID